MNSSQTRVRVLRLIEYEFDDQQTADDQILHMTQTLKVGKMRMRSTLLQMPLPDFPEREVVDDRKGVRGGI